MKLLRTSSNISKDTMEWLLYLVTNLNGDASFLTIPAPTAHSLPCSKDPPFGDIAGTSDHHVQHLQVDEEVIFDGNLVDLVGGTLQVAMKPVEQVVVEDTGGVNVQATEEHNEVQDVVLYH